MALKLTNVIKYTQNLKIILRVPISAFLYLQHIHTKNGAHSGFEWNMYSFHSGYKFVQPFSNSSALLLLIV